MATSDVHRRVRDWPTRRKVIFLNGITYRPSSTDHAAIGVDLKEFFSKLDVSLASCIYNISLHMIANGSRGIFLVVNNVIANMLF